MGNIPEVLNFNRLVFKLNRCICTYGSVLPFHCAIHNEESNYPQSVEDRVLATRSLPPVSRPSPKHRCIRTPGWEVTAFSVPYIVEARRIRSSSFLAPAYPTSLIMHNFCLISSSITNDLYHIFMQCTDPDFLVHCVGFYRQPRPQDHHLHSHCAGFSFVYVPVAI